MVARVIEINLLLDAELSQYASFSTWRWIPILYFHALNRL